MTVSLHGKPLHLKKTPPQKGEKIKDFTIINNKLEPLSFYSLLGDCTLLLTIPSCDTQVCSLELNSLQKQMEKNSINLSCIAVSMDLPFAQERWQRENGCAKLSLFSDYLLRECGDVLGVFLPKIGLLARACFVIDQNKVIQHMELVSEISQEPDYKKIFQSITSLKGKSA